MLVFVFAGEHKEVNHQSMIIACTDLTVQKKRRPSVCGVNFGYAAPDDHDSSTWREVRNPNTN